MIRSLAVSVAAMALALVSSAAQGQQVAAPVLSKDALATQIGEKPTSPIASCAGSASCASQ